MIRWRQFNKTQNPQKFTRRTKETKYAYIDLISKMTMPKTIIFMIIIFSFPDMSFDTRQYQVFCWPDVRKVFFRSLLNILEWERFSGYERSIIICISASEKSSGICACVFFLNHSKYSYYYWNNGCRKCHLLVISISRSLYSENWWHFWMRCLCWQDDHVYEITYYIVNYSL